MTYWILLRDWTARVCEGKGLRSVDAYLKGLISEIEYHRRFNCMKNRLSAKERGRYLETVGSL